MHSSLRTGSLAELIVAYRFLELSRRPAWPLTVCGYDLLIDGGDAVFRVQVKQAANKEGSGWHVVLTSKSIKKEGWSTKFDYLCAVVDPENIYVIPRAAILAAHAPNRPVTSLYVGKNSRFNVFLNAFAIGEGDPVGKPQHVGGPVVAVGQRRSFWYAKQGDNRKRHRHLSASDIESLRGLPIRMFKYDPECPEGVPVEQIAQQFGVSVQGMRNLLRGKRKDLKQPILSEDGKAVSPQDQGK